MGVETVHGLQMLPIDEIRRGDLIKLGSSFRLVRGVSKGAKNKSNDLWWFAILRRSWTNRCYTVYNPYDFSAQYKGVANRDFPLYTTIKASKVQMVIDLDVAGQYRFDKQPIITADQMAGEVP